MNQQRSSFSHLASLLCLLPLVAACTGSIGDDGDDSNESDGSGGGAAAVGGGATDPDGDGQGNEGSGAQGSGAPTQGQPASDGVFEKGNPWTKSVAELSPSPSSGKIINWLDANGGWGYGEMRIDFGMEVVSADALAPMVDFEATDEFYTPDCDHVPVPLPPSGAIEAESGYACTGDGDCHLLVVHEPTKTLYEMWRADFDGSKLYGGCTAKWDLTRAYGDNLRGDGCSSADGGGFPITPLLFTADEIAQGEIRHAIRFILPNARIRKQVYVHPGTHSSFSTSGGADAPPYGVRLRLRADFPMDKLATDGARVVARALQRYGMLLADGGNITLTGRSDRFTQHKWAEVGVDAQSLTSIQVTDMEVVDMGEPIPWSGDCIRNP